MKILNNVARLMQAKKQKRNKEQGLDEAEFDQFKDVLNN
jgi:hypothetical protein